jgi:hypothetical protein
MAVLVSVIDGDLVVTGDGQADQVAIVQTLQNGQPVAGRYFVAGQNGTTINGQATGQFVQDVRRDIVVNLNGNNDRLTVGNGIDGDFIAPRDLQIDTGAGADVVNINQVNVRDDLGIITGNGSDIVSVRATIGALPGIDGGFNDLFINTGEQSDRVLVQNTFVRSNLSIATGNDTFGDIVDILFSNVGDDTSITTGGGGDTVRISDVGFNDNLVINSGDGIDTVRLTRVAVDELFANLGAGGDRLELRDSFGRRATLNGQTGADTLTRINTPFAEFFQANSF